MEEISDVKSFKIHPIAPIEDEQEPIAAHDVEEWTNMREPVTWQGNMNAFVELEEGFRRALNRFMRPTKYPRKLKKAVKQMWVKKLDGVTLEISFKPMRRTKWQRKACRKIRMYDNSIEYPMPSGNTMVIHLNNPSS